MRSSSVEEVGGHGPGDPWEVFTALAILVVEGRTPGGERGYHAGPHCPLPYQLQHKHECDQNDHQCIQAGALVRQLRVMWGAGVGVSLEVLVAPECKHGAALATTLDTTIAPSQNLRLIEQWNFTISDRRLPEAIATGSSLVAAVRSFLHFSQLSAWLSVSKGRRPPNVLYRCTVTSPVFCSKFTEETDEHVFPLAYMGQETSIKVAVRSLPRSEKVPVVICQESHDDSEEMPSEDSHPSSSQSKSEMARCEDDLRRSIMKAKLSENSRVTRSESPDTQLGESLLDPPNSLNRFPRRYQSPSRSGSPSLETPEHLICRHRHPVPPNSRPPDGVMAPSTSRHPFSWTQTRYPMPSINLNQTESSLSCSMPSSSINVASSSNSPAHPYRHHPHHEPKLMQSPYRIDYSGSHSSFQRPQLVFTHPQIQQSIEKPPHNHTASTAHQQQLHLNQLPCSQHPAMSTASILHPPSGHDQFHKQGRLSPRGGKYQNYPEYQYDQTDMPVEDHTVGEYYEPPQSNKDGENSHLDYYTRLKIRKEYLENSAYVSKNHSPISSSRAELSHQNEKEEYQSQWEYRKNNNNDSRSYHPYRASSSSSELNQQDVRKSNCKSRAHLKRSSDSSNNHKSEWQSIGVVDDQLRPCCSHTGKHLCSSIEDLTEICDKEEVEKDDCGQSHTKSLKQELKHKGDVNSSHLFHNKFDFDLTPKETLEILSVLRHSSNMRIDNSQSISKISSNQLQSNDTSLHFNSELKLGKMWDNVDVDNKYTKDKNLWTGEYLDYSLASPEKDSLKSDNCKNLDTSWKQNPDYHQFGPSIPSCSFSPSSSSFSFSTTIHSGHSNERCQNESRDKGNQHELPSDPDNQFLEAIALSGEKHCDISSCKDILDNSCEAYRTKVFGETICDNDSDVHKDIYINALKERCKEKEEEKIEEERHGQREEQQCVDAKRITYKTNSFTACSEPASFVKCQPQKQVSHTLGKSPFSAIIPSIQTEYNQDASTKRRCQKQQQQQYEKQDNSSKSGEDISEYKENVKRSLNFQNENKSNQANHFKNQVVTKSEEDLKATETKTTNIHSRERKTGFIKSQSLLKQLMTYGHSTINKTQDEENDKDHLVTNGDVVNKEVISDQKTAPQNGGLQESVITDTQNYSEENGFVIGELVKRSESLEGISSDDDEVEKYCLGKGIVIPSASEKAQFRRSLDSATTMVFHCKTGLPLTSSPAPLRKGKRFDYDSSLISVAAIKRSTSFHCSALYTCDAEEEETENVEPSNKSPRTSVHQLSVSAPATVTCSNLLGSFEECVLNGRLEPVSTVQGFVAEIAASGAFCPKRTTKPVTVFFYTLCDNDQISSPYMCHINLGKKGYHVPNKGTIQVTLFNPHGTVVKMFVIMYDLSDMPPNSRTFIRQRTLNMPVGASDVDDDAHQWLRYLIHLRFVSSKSGKIYLHTDIRMLILRKSDADAATLHKTSVPYELRSFTHGPTNPKFSPRK